MHIDYDLAPYVDRSFKKKMATALMDRFDIDEEHAKILALPTFIGCDKMFTEEDTILKKAYEIAMRNLEKEGKQAAQGLYHNLNTLESRPGSQLPFTSINFGLDTSPEGRLVTKWLLEASIDGIGKAHRTSIFPISIFQMKKGINMNPGDPNYDLKCLAMKSLSRRIYPNIVNNDWSQNEYDSNNPDTAMATMGK